MQKQRIISYIKSDGNSVSKDAPSWAGIHSLLSDSNLQLMQVGFLPFIPKPVPECAIVYTALLNFVKVTYQFNQKDLLVFCDEGVFRTIAEIIS